MKTKFILFVLVLVSCFACTFCLSACEEAGENENGTPQHVHDLTHYEEIAATCTENGSSEYWYCSACGKYFSDENGTKEIQQDSWIIAATGHIDLEHMNAEEPTCTEEGNSEYWHCSACGKYFSDENAANEIQKDSWVIPATGHGALEHFIAKEPTCTEAGNSEYWSCPDCGQCFSDSEGQNAIEKDTVVIPATAHSKKQHFEPTAATCTESGNSEYWYCPDCEKYFADADCEEEIAKDSWMIEAKGHSYSSEWSYDDEYHWHAAICEHTDEISEKERHNFVDNTCTVCGVTVDYTVGLEYMKIYSSGKLSAYQVNGIGSAEGPEIIIPAQYNGLPVTEINDWAFSDCSSIESLTIPDSVTYIGKGIVSGCDALKDITLPFIGSDLTDRADMFLAYIFGGSSHNDSSYVKTSVKTVTLTNCTSVPDYAFYKCSSIENVILPDDITTIGSNAFYYCQNLADIVLPQSVTKIGDSAFYYCNALSEFDLPEKLETIGSAAFKYCSSLSSISFPETLTEIDSAAFMYCTSLEEVLVPESVLTIGSGAFSGCKNLNKITLPFVGEKADGTGATHLGYIFGIDKYNSTERIPTSLKTVVLSQSCSVIPTNAFYNCTTIENFVLPDTLVRINSQAFYNCGFTNFVVPEKVETIGNGAFNKCSLLTAITLSDSLRTIGNSAFSECKVLKEIVVPDGVESIGYSAFYFCNQLQSVTIPFVGGGNSDAGPQKGENYHFGYIFGAASWENNDSTVPKSIKHVTVTKKGLIQRASFYGCDAIESVTLLAGTRVVTYAFNGCSSLKTVVLPDTLQEISSRGFSGCKSLVSIELPESLVTIAGSAFLNCSNLTDITYAGTQEQWNAITKASDWDSSTGAYTIHCSDADITKS